MIKHILFFVLFFMNLTTHAAVQTDTHTYIVSREENRVLSIDRRTGKEKIFQVGESPRSMVIHGRFGFVVNAKSNSISVINLKKQEVVNTLVVDELPFSIVTHGGVGYILGGGPNINVFVLSTNYEVQSGGVGEIRLQNSRDYTKYYPKSMIVHGKLAYVTASLSDLIFIIDNETNTQTNISVGSYVRSMRIHGDFAYVSTEQGLVILDLRTHTVANTIPMDPNIRFDIFIHGDHLFVAADNLNVIDLKTNTLTDSIPIGPYVNSVVIHGNFAYVASQNLNQLRIIDLRTKSTQVLSVHSPESTVIHGNYGYVVSKYSPYVNVLDLSTNQLIMGIENPNQLDIDFSDTHVYLGVHKSVPLFFN